MQKIRELKCKFSVKVAKDAVFFRFRGFWHFVEFEFRKKLKSGNLRPRQVLTYKVFTWFVGVGLLLAFSGFPSRCHSRPMEWLS